MILKNIANQGIFLYAHNTVENVPQTGDAANITGTLCKDGLVASITAFATANPIEFAGGLYWQPFSQEETNADAMGMVWTSTTAATQIDPITILTDRGGIRANATSGTGAVVIDHNYNGVDSLIYMTPASAPINDAIIWCYRRADYDAFRRSTQYILARTTTDVNGRWVAPMLLDPGTMLLIYFKQGLYGPNKVELTVS